MVRDLAEKLKHLKGNHLLAGSVIVFVGSFGAGVLGYIFHFLMGRLLSPSDYGVLNSFLSLLYIIGVPGAVLVTTATKFASKYKVAKDFEAVTSVLVWTSKCVFVLGLLLLFLSIPLSSRIADFMNVSDQFLPVVFMVFIALSLLGSAPQGFLRGLLRFKAFAFLSLWGPFLKLSLAALFVISGLGVRGVFWGLVLSSTLGLLASLVLLKKNLRFPFSDVSFSKRDLLSYAAPTVLILLAANSLYNADIILVKHFFPAEEAGIYSSVTTLGRIIFFSLNSIIMVMFPMVSEKYEGGGDFWNVFEKSLILLSFGALLAWGVYTFFPGLLVQLLFGSAYLKATPYLGRFALFMGLYSIIYLLIQFFLSIRELWVVVPLSFLAGIHILSLWFLHHSLLEVIHVNIGAALGTLFLLGLYWWRVRSRLLPSR